jgi:Ca-activated chloride channel family protein
MNGLRHVRWFILASLAALDAESIRVHTDLVLIDAVVTDRQGRVIRGLDASKFLLYEDEIEQTIKYCSSEDAPVSLGLLLDASGGMGAMIPLS